MIALVANKYWRVNYNSSTIGILTYFSHFVASIMFSRLFTPVVFLKTTTAEPISQCISTLEQLALKQCSNTLYCECQNALCVRPVDSQNTFSPFSENAAPGRREVCACLYSYKIVWIYIPPSTREQIYFFFLSWKNSIYPVAHTQWAKSAFFCVCVLASAARRWKGFGWVPGLRLLICVPAPMLSVCRLCVLRIAIN